MKPRLLLLALSLLANAGLVIAYLTASAPSHPPAISPDSTATRTATTHASNATANQPTAAGAAPRDGFSWAAMATDDLDELRRRLKAAGFTPQEVRLILARRIADLTRRPGMNDPTKPTSYWRPLYRYDRPTGKAAEEARQREIEEARLHRKYLMGPDSLADDPERLEFAKRQWGDLPLEKLQAIATIEADYGEMARKQMAERHIRPGEQSNVLDAQRLLQQERMADIAKILTPEEFAAFELRASSTANILRARLEPFKATEEEFKELFAINKDYEDRWTDRQLTSDARTALRNEITAKVQEAIGADRALDYDAVMYENSTDQTAGLVSRLGLPARVAVEVRQAQQDFTQRAKDLRADTALSANERNAQLTALAQQATTQLTAKLGTNGYEAYTDLKGEWIRALQPKSGP